LVAVIRLGLTGATSRNLLASSLTKKVLEASFGSMRSVELKVLKNRLSEYVRLAAAGETVLVTDRDRIVAELVPPQKRTVPEDEFLAKGVREGWLTPARTTDGSPPPAGKPVVGFEELMREIAADREDR
jgi:antitoxin (DNA-binding transcriptional repressor) of toxin-antitoxin stability system